MGPEGWVAQNFALFPLPPQFPFFGNFKDVCVLPHIEFWPFFWAALLKMYVFYPTRNFRQFWADPTFSAVRSTFLAEGSGPLPLGPPLLPLAKPSLAKPTLAKKFDRLWPKFRWPTLAKPTLAKILVADFGQGPRRAGPRKVGGQKIRAFFFPLPPQFSFFPHLLGVLSWNFGGV